MNPVNMSAVVFSAFYKETVLHGNGSGTDFCIGSSALSHPVLLLRHLSALLQNKFDHGAESVMPTLLNLVPNSAKVIATSGMAAIRLILRVRAVGANI